MLRLRPYPWQSRFALEAGQASVGLCCAAAPGAGKTYAALMVADEVLASFILVIAPPGRVCQQWLTVAESQGFNASIIGGKRQGGSILGALITECHQEAQHRPLIAILPWSRLQRPRDSKAILGALQRLSGDSPPIDLLIVDESHYAQGAEQTQRGAALLGTPKRQGVRHYARRTIALTGTPSTSKPQLLRAQLLLTGAEETHPVLRSAWSYEARYWGGRMEYSDAAKRQLWTVNDTAANDHGQIVTGRVMVIDTAELRKSLPGHRREILYDLASGAVPRELTLWADAAAAGHHLKIPQLEDLATIRQEATESRLDDIAALADSWHGEAEDRRLLLIWTVYRASAARMAEALAHLGAVALHGGMTDAARRSVLEQATGGKIRCLVATMASTGTGVDGLQRVSDRALCLEAPWTPGEAEQVEGRLFRQGQDRPVLTQWVAAGVEGAILRAIGVKSECLTRVLAPAEKMTLTDRKDT